MRSYLALTCLRMVYLRRQILTHRYAVGQNRKHKTNTICYLSDKYAIEICVW